MASVTYNKKTYTLDQKETVLDGLLRHGIEAAYSCRSGACQACMMRSIHGVPPSNSQLGLKDTLQEQGYFLACQCIPENDLEIGDAHTEISAVVTLKEKLNESVVRLSLSPQESFAFRAGQYIQLVRDDGLIRSYSIASLPGEDIDLHIERVPNGVMSNWVADDVQVGQEVKLRGPVGDCFYVPGKADQPLLLVGTATGLAPLYGILRDALHNNHTAPIYLFHGSTVIERLYYQQELQGLSQKHANLHYQACALHGESDDNVIVGDIQKIALSIAESFQGWRSYLCGNPDLVYSLRKQIFLKGASNKEIFSDAFLHTKPVG